jgi:hypothetical protein
MLERFEKFFDSGLRDTPTAIAARSMDALNPMSMGQNAFRPLTIDAAVGGGNVFLTSELEKLDPKVREPLTSVTYMRDMPIKSGGGWVNFTSNFFVDYAISGPNLYGLMGTQTTDIPVIQGNISKDVFRVFNWGNILKVSFIDLQLMQQAGRSLEDLLNTGIKLNWNKTLDLVTYTHAYPGIYGLLNNPDVSATSVAQAESGNGTEWIYKTPDEIINDINTALLATWAASEYDVSGMATQLLLPPAQFGYMATQKMSLAGSTSILTYLLENNIAKTQGRDLKIFPSRWCIGAGLAGTDRMVAYVADADRLYLDITVPIQRVMTMPTVSEGGAYLTLYSAQVGQVKILFFQTIAYLDGI